MTRPTGRPRGRPPAHPDERRRQVQVRMSPLELAELEAAAERDEQPLTTWVREAALRVARRG